MRPVSFGSAHTFQRLVPARTAHPRRSYVRCAFNRPSSTYNRPPGPSYATTSSYATAWSSQYDQPRSLMPPPPITQATTTPPWRISVLRSCPAAVPAKTAATPAIRRRQVSRTDQRFPPLTGNVKRAGTTSPARCPDQARKRDSAVTHRHRVGRGSRCHAPALEPGSMFGAGCSTVPRSSPVVSCSRSGSSGNHASALVGSHSSHSSPTISKAAARRCQSVAFTVNGSELTGRVENELGMLVPTG